jgi:catechol-2,3-dioxygenase
MVVRVNRISFLGLGSVDHDRMIDHYRRVIGLPVAYEAPSELFLACGIGHHALALHRDSHAGHRYVGLEIGSGVSLKDAALDLTKAGIRAETQTDAFPGISDCILIRDPDGYAIYLHSSAEFTARSQAAPLSSPDKLGHVAMFVGNANSSQDFYREHLGFRMSDWVEDYFVFMRCNADHHGLNFQRADRKGMFHFAFELRDASRLIRNCDNLALNGAKILWGPGRHGPGHNIFTYHRDPDGNIVEFYCELDRMSDESLGYFDPRPHHQHFPQQPRVWSLKETPGPANIWGPHAPQGWRD